MTRFEDNLPKHKDVTAQELEDARTFPEYFKVLEEVRCAMIKTATRDGRAKIGECRRTLESIRKELQKLKAKHSTAEKKPHTAPYPDTHPLASPLPSPGQTVPA